MAEGIFNQIAGQRGIEAKAESAGISVVNEYPASEGAILAAKAAGIDLTAHRSRKITRELLKAADQVRTMSKGHRDVLSMMYPEFLDKIKTLSPRDIEDPYGRKQEAYDAAFQSIRLAVEAMIKELP
jgi:protein-tyrosine phosphatase